MIISHKYKLIFIHIYKNAGTFITELLKKLDKDIVNVDVHISAKNAKNKFPELWNNYTKICVVRNSWDWQMSLLFYMKGSRSHHQYHIVKNMNVAQYLEWRKTDLRQQIEFILDDNSNCLIDNILPFENINVNIINFFKDKYNIDISSYVPRNKINSSKRNIDYREYYNDEDKKKLSELHHPDIEYFKFEF
jgi:hypothetical protein